MANTPVLSPKQPVILVWEAMDKSSSAGSPMGTPLNTLMLQVGLLRVTCMM